MSISLGEGVEMVVAGATLALAGTTAWLAKRTHQVASETTSLAREAKREVDVMTKQTETAERQVEVATAAMLASTRPWLTPTGLVALEPAKGGFGMTCRGRLRNVGNGLALITPKRCLITGSYPGGLRRLANGYVREPAVASGDETIFFIAIRDVADNPKDIVEPTGEERYRRFWIEIHYTDASGGQGTWIRLEMYGEPDSPLDWWARSASYFHELDDSEWGFDVRAQPFTRAEFLFPGREKRPPP